jgi:cell division protein FtsI (penicillin-binding protein 3)
MVSWLRRSLARMVARVRALRGSRRGPRTPRGTGYGAGVGYASSPLLAAKTPVGRSKFLVALVAVSFLVLLARAAYIQIVGVSFYVHQGDKRVTHTLDLPASRGRILDRNGQVLASSVAAPSVWAAPREMDLSAPKRQELAKALGMERSELDERLRENNRFVWLRRLLDEPQWGKVQALKIKGIYATPEFRRVYPEGASTAHVVGFTQLLQDRGLEGMELHFQRELQGQAGNRAVVKDRLGRVIDDVGEANEAVHGRDVQLSIDAKIQHFAYQRLKETVTHHRANSGSAVVIDVQTGEVLALANYPSYDPSQRPTQVDASLRNRALTDIFEPGSTVKPFIAAMALQRGQVRPDTVLDTSPGSLVVGPKVIRDSGVTKRMSVTEVVQKSSNIGTVRMAMDMPPQEMWSLYSQLGFGQKPELQYPGIASGKLRPHKTWKPVEQATMAYGYGLSASLFQLARAYTVFARDGELVPVTLLKRSEPVAGTRVIEAKAAGQVRDMLRLVVSQEGTARRAETEGFSVGGKTGTAFTHREGGGYNSDKYRSWFVGLAPIKNPRIVVAVLVDEPATKQHTGGEVAAPAFSQIVQQVLRIKGVTPDIDVRVSPLADGASKPPPAPTVLARRTP